MISTVQYNIDYEQIIKDTKNLKYEFTNHDDVQDTYTLYRDGFKCTLPEGYTKQTIIDTVKNYDVNSCCIRILKPFSGYSIHTDQYRWNHPYTYHIVLQSEPGNYFCYPERMDGPQMITLQDKTVLYKINAQPMHTFVNLSGQPRIHVTFESMILDKRSIPDVPWVI